MRSAIRFNVRGPTGLALSICAICACVACAYCSGVAGLARELQEQVSRFDSGAMALAPCRGRGATALDGRALALTGGSVARCLGSDAAVSTAGASSAVPWIGGAGRSRGATQHVGVLVVPEPEHRCHHEQPRRARRARADAAWRRGWSGAAPDRLRRAAGGVDLDGRIVVVE